MLFLPNYYEIVTIFAENTSALLNLSYIYDKLFS